MNNKLLPFQGPRLVFFKVIVIACFMVLIMRLYEWQFTRYDEFQAGAQENAIQSLPLQAPRGVIYDRYGVGLALNTPAFNVTVIPANLPDDQEQALAVLNRLSALIDVPATRAAADAAGKRNVRSLEEMVKEGEGIAPYRPVIVTTDITQIIAQEILEDKRNLPGVGIEYGPVRQYPSGATTSQIVGYLGPIGAAEAEKLRETGYNPAFDRVGFAGVEAYMDEELSGKRGLLTQEVDVAGLPVRTISRVEPVAGKNVRLSIDLQLQKGTELALTNRISIINTAELRTVTQSGVAIVMNPNTGEILSMVTWPTYDNTRFARSIDAEYYLRVLGDSQLPLVNHAVSSLYPPGSTWKLLTATGVTQEQIIDPHSFLNDPGELFVKNSFAPNDPGKRQRFVCWLPAPGHGRVDLIRAIAWSCDVYFYQVGGGNPEVSPQTLRPNGLGITNLDRYATMFGIGTTLGVELYGEVSGRMPDPDWKRRLYGESWSTGDTYNAAFGQGYVTVTPLQMIASIVPIVNGGTFYKPTLINSWVDAENNILQPLQSEVARTLVLPTDGSPAVLNVREDMFIQGPNSLACVCASNSPYTDPTDPDYDPTLPKCTEDFRKNYKANVRVDRDMNVADDIHNWQDVNYTVLVPNGYSFFNQCSSLQYKPDYQPPFVDPINLGFIREGMRGAVTDPGGTAFKGFEGFGHDVAGKSGTAEYCDNIANQKGLCIAGSWPAHAWFIAFAPYDHPEVIAVAFIYNGLEGSRHALPVVKDAINCYYHLKTERLKANGGPVKDCESIQTQ
jgi:penicillin-binding protein 2